MLSKLEKYFWKIYNYFSPKYVIIQGAGGIYNNRYVFSLIKVDKTHREGFTIKDEKTGKTYYKSNIYLKIYRFKTLMKYGRLLAFSRTKPLTWQVLEIVNKRSKTLRRIENEK